MHAISCRMMHFLLLTIALLLPFVSVSARKHSVKTIPIYGNSADGYYITLKIGTPPQKINVLVDTGSSNLAVAASSNSNLSIFYHIDVSISFQKLNKFIEVEYTEGSWKGILGTDFISLPTISDVKSNLACIMSSQNFFANFSKWQGILGLAYSQIAKPDPSFVAYFDILVRSLNISNIFSMLLCGKEGRPGELVLGGISSKLYNGEVLYVPLQKEWYYEVLLTDIVLGSNHWPHDCQQLNEDKTIVDSGTSDLRLPMTVFGWFANTLWMHSNITLQKSFWMNNQILCFHGDISSIFPVLVLTLHREGRPLMVNISPKLYFRSAFENDDIPTDGKMCYKLAVSSSNKGTVIGAAILEGFYVVFDREKSAVGFGNSTCMQNGSLRVGWVTLGPFSERGSGDCIFVREHDQNDSIFNVTAYVLVAVCVICVIPLLVMLLHWIWHHLVCFKADSESNSLLEEYH